jgi:SAM-dependent methyltransferase
VQAAAAADRGTYRVLDIGCSDRRNETVFTTSGGDYVGCDAAWNPLADVHGWADALPVEDASFDVVVCTYVLEHVSDPASTIRELRRVVRSGGRVLASTHGTAVYHPNPVDLSRRTHAGLEKLFRDNADWSSVSVRPAQGTAATTAMLVAHLVDLSCKRLRVRMLSRPFVSALNALGEAPDRAVPQLREPISPARCTRPFMSRRFRSNHSFGRRSSPGVRATGWSDTLLNSLSNETMLAIARRLLVSA